MTLRKCFFFIISLWKQLQPQLRIQFSHRKLFVFFVPFLVCEKKKLQEGNNWSINLTPIITKNNKKLNDKLCFQ